jgi:hypothetical protein
VQSALEMPRLRLVPLTPAIACRSTTLPPPFHDDPADPIIVATARQENATVLTADQRIRAYPHCRSIWREARGTGQQSHFLVFPGLRPRYPVSLSRLNLEPRTLRPRHDR